MSGPPRPADRVLLTGGRAPVTLELARLLARDGATVHVAESLPLPLTRLSRHVRHHRVPPPRQDPDGFLGALEALVARHGIELLLPTCEETFYVARSPRLPAPLPPPDLLRQVHHKGSFPALARRLGIPAPETRTVTDRADLHEAVLALAPAVVKPAFSRFATHVLRDPDPASLAPLVPTPARPWVVQRALPGPERCTASVAWRGRLVAHADYRPHFTVNRAAVAFTHTADPLLEERVSRFVAGTGWTGLVAFDWREGPDGPAAIECNPRATSGLHLLAGVPGFPALLRQLHGAGPPPGQALLRPAPGTAAQVALAMVMYGTAARPPEGRRPWLRTLSRSRDVLWAADDPLPFVLGLLPWAHLAWAAARHRTSMLEASTLDIRWDGE